MIIKESMEFAVFWHNHRGECEGIRVISNGYEQDPPFGICSSFLTGGGPHPLGLSDKAESYLDELSQKLKAEQERQGNL
jgi:hypothetical protein